MITKVLGVNSIHKSENIAEKLLENLREGLCLENSGRGIEERDNVIEEGGRKQRREICKEVPVQYPVLQRGESLGEPCWSSLSRCEGTNQIVSSPKERMAGDKRKQWTMLFESLMKREKERERGGNSLREESGLLDSNTVHKGPCIAPEGRG